MTGPSMRVRVRFSKGGPLRYIGNLDLHTIFERAARRADLPLAYSHGFHPQPKIQLASPLPLGCSSRCEVVDLRLEGEVELAAVGTRLQAAMPDGIGILSVQTVEPEAPALQAALLSAEYSVSWPAQEEVGPLADRVEAIREAETLPRERRGRAYDLRPLIEELKLEFDNSDGTARLQMRLSAREGATGRPDEVLDALGLPLEAVRIERTSLNFRS